MDHAAKIKRLCHNIKNSLPLKNADKEFILTLTNTELINIIDVYDVHLKYVTELFNDLIC
jgi:hypothetical protein